MENTLSDKLNLLTKPNIEIESGENQMNQNTKTILSNFSYLQVNFQNQLQNLFILRDPRIV